MMSVCHNSKSSVPGIRNYKLEDDLIIMIPRKDAVLFAPAGNKETVQKMIDHGEQAYEQGENKISKNLYRFSRERKELVTYEE